MKKVIFVGDKPSSRNLNPKIAFVGTPSHKTLKSWIENIQKGLLFTMQYELINSDTKECIKNLKKLKKEKNSIFIALGNNVCPRLDKIKIKYFKLPHPSPKNFKLNDEEYVRQILNSCTIYISENVRKDIIENTKGFFDD